LIDVFPEKATCEVAITEELQRRLLATAALQNRSN
jgi:hypothetical protein